MMMSDGPLSWQQAVNLERNHRLGVGTGQHVGRLAVPEDEPVARWYERLAAIVRREDALRITRLPPDGSGTVSYAEDIDLPVRTVRADSLEQVEALIGELRTPRFRYDDDRPLWQVVVIEHPDQAGKPTRTSYAALDHFIVDGRSGTLFRDELAGRTSHRPAIFRGGYREWVDWQHEQFPMRNPASTPTPAREFWRRYFDGSAPNHATALPFSSPQTPLSGLEHHMYRDLPVSSEQLRAAAARLLSPPFLLFVASVAAAAASYTPTEDMTLRYYAHGRTPRYLDTIGWFSDHIPLRVRGSSLTDPEQALRAARAARRNLADYETTPWGYIMAACGQTDSEQPQIVLNFVQFDRTVADIPRPPDSTVVCSRGYLDLTVGVPSTGIGLMRSRFDPKRFARDDVEAFGRVVLDRMRRLVEE